MKVSRLNISLLLSLLLLLFSSSVTARADDDEEDDDYDVKARVVRVSLINGDVNLKRNGGQEWEAARLNHPLVEGDTVNTGKDGRLEIQIDARNYLRLAQESSLRIVTLRDEGIAVSLVEGTAAIRLAKFDRSKEYFEVDAPKSTLAAEKPGLYRIDVSPEGRVRLTVRDAGSARIYSDTSGFVLRDGRSAELLLTGETAGDWELLAAAPRDAIDEWVSDRERFLAQRTKQDSRYYDEYVWGAEDLDAYGDWSYAEDYGWMWRPHGSVISAYHDWAPYRHGYWTWCPPYGWTWVGYEPWGWAPYHFGRWVYHNDYWAWVPRSRFHRKRSWWRPALVAFVNFNFSFGDNICWYPLSYYQRDPHSRRYRHDNRRYDGDRRHGDGNNRHRYDNDRRWRGVTRVPRGDFGNRERRGEVVEETIARRVIDTEPRPGVDLPRGGWSRRVPEGDQGPGRAGRITPVIAIPNRDTGAAERSPGVSMDEDLRRERIYRGREPRRNQPGDTTTATTPAATTSSAPQTEPTGVVARPEPRSRQKIEAPRSEPRSQPKFEAPRSESPSQPALEAPRSEARPQPKFDAPRSEPRSEPRSQPKIEAPRSEPRSEPRSQPKFEAPRSEPRSEPRSQPKIEAPRSEPRSEPRSQPRSEPSRSESPRGESPRSAPPRSDPSPRSDPPRSESPRSESPRSESPRSDPPRSESPRSESPRSENPRPGKPDNPLR